MSQPRQPPLHQQHQQTVSHRPMPAAPPGRRRTAQGNAPLLLRRPGPPNHLTSAPAAATPHSGGGGRLRDISLASLLEGVDQVPSARKRLVPTSAGVLASGVSRPGVMQAKVPLRTTKTSQKEVLLPENANAIESDSSSNSDDEEPHLHARHLSPTRMHSPTWHSKQPPTSHQQVAGLPPSVKPRKSFAERLAKSQRDESMLPRVTAYCTCEAYKLVAVQKFLTEHHSVKGAVIYNEALHARYDLPLRSGEGGYRVKSGEPKEEDLGGREYSSDSEGQARPRGVSGDEERDGTSGNTVGSSAMLDAQMSDETLFSPPKEDVQSIPKVHFLEEEDQKAQEHHEVQRKQAESPERPILKRRDSVPADVNALSNLAELFVFSYGVVVFWNFTERQEKDILADFTFASTSLQPQEGPQPARPSRKRSISASRITSPPELTPLFNQEDDEEEAIQLPASLYPRLNPFDWHHDKKATPPPRNAGLMIRVLKEMDVQIEDFHFEYNPRTRSPRIRDDMITLRTPSPKIKLAISHAIAQSVKLSVFEDAMENTMTSSKFLPAELARRGELGLTRREVVRMSGRLFRLRVGIMLGGAVLDTPEWFWESEPELHALYSAVREYLELSSRVQVLNDRCEVLFDLLDILSDSIAESNMGRITWIIIALILLSVLVTSLEVVFRVKILRRHGSKKF